MQAENEVTSASIDSTARPGQSGLNEELSEVERALGDSEYCFTIRGRRLRLLKDEFNVNSRHLDALEIFAVLRNTLVIAYRSAVVGNSSHSAVRLPTGPALCFSEGREFPLEDLEKQKTDELLALYPEAGILTDLALLKGKKQAWCLTRAPSIRALTPSECTQVLRAAATGLGLPVRDLSEVSAETKTKGFSPIIITKSGLTTAGLEGRTDLKIICQPVRGDSLLREENLLNMVESLKVVVGKVDRTFGAEMWKTVETKFRACGIDLSQFSQDGRISVREQQILDCRYNPLTPHTSHLPSPPSVTLSRRRRSFSMVELGGGGDLQSALEQINNNFEKISHGHNQLSAELLQVKAGLKLENRINQHQTAELSYEQLVSFGLQMEILTNTVYQMFRAEHHQMMMLITEDLSDLINRLEGLIRIADNLMMTSKFLCSDTLCSQSVDTALSVSPENTGITIHRRGFDIGTKRTLILSCPLTPDGQILNGNFKPIVPITRRKVRVGIQTFTLDCLRNHSLCSPASFQKAARADLIGGNIYIFLTPRGSHMQCLKRDVLFTYDDAGNKEFITCDMQPRAISFPAVIARSGEVIGSNHHHSFRYNFPHEIITISEMYRKLHNDSFGRRVESELENIFSQTWESLSSSDLKPVHIGFFSGSLAVGAVAAIISLCACFCPRGDRPRRPEREAESGEEKGKCASLHSSDCSLTPPITRRRKARKCGLCCALGRSSQCCNSRENSEDRSVQLRTLRRLEGRRGAPGTPYLIGGPGTLPPNWPPSTSSNQHAEASSDARLCVPSSVSGGAEGMEYSVT